MAPLSRLALIASFTLLAGGCGDSHVESYRVPHEKDPELPGAPAGQAPEASAGPSAPGPTPSMAETPVSVAEGPGLAWTAPANWTAKPATAMRKGSYAVGDADLSITAFPGDVGGELANVNRWRGMVGLSQLAPEALSGSVSRLSHDGLSFTVVDLASTGANAQRILGAIVPYGGGTWFFKLMGSDATVAGAKPDFMKFLSTVKPSATP